MHTVGGMNGRLVANICRACPEPVPCVEACPTDALVTREGRQGIKFYKGKCIDCGLCVEACPVHVIGWDDVGPVPAEGR